MFIEAHPMSRNCAAPVEDKDEPDKVLTLRELMGFVAFKALDSNFGVSY